MSISSGCYNFNFVPVSFISSPHSQYDPLPSVSGVRFMDFSRTSTTSSVSLFDSHSSSNKNRWIRLSGVGSDSGEVKSGDSGQFEVSDAGSGPRTDIHGGDGNRNGSAGDSFGGGGGSGGGKDENCDDDNGKELGPVLKFEDVMAELNNQGGGVTLPSDMFAAAKTTGIRKLLLLRYLDLQVDANLIQNDALSLSGPCTSNDGSVWPLGFLMKFCSLLRNRMLADPSFLFKIGAEVVIDFCCGTFAEVQKRGKDFWGEFELYAADMLVGVVVDVALVGLLAPYARIGQRSISTGLFGQIQQACAALPSSVFEAERPGCRFTAKQRIATYFYKGVLYGAVGFGCGLIGQGIANFIMNAKRSLNKSDDHIPVPPLVRSAALWGVFLAVSSNTRYQIVNGLEQLVEASPLAKRVPPVAMAFTVGVRFANNIYGGMQFVDWAKWSGVQ